MRHLVVGALLAEGPVNNGPDFGKASPVGLLIVVLLLIAVLLLGWSMNRQLKKVPASFDDAGSETEPGPAVGDAPPAAPTAPATSVDPAAEDAVLETGTDSAVGESNG